MANGNMVLELESGEKVQIQFQHDRLPIDPPLGMKSYFERQRRLEKQGDDPITWVWLKHRDRNHPKNGLDYQDADGTPWIESVIKHADERENRKLAREYAVKKLLNSKKEDGTPLMSKENQLRIQKAFDGRLG